MKHTANSIRRAIYSLGVCAGLTLAQPVAAASLDLNFNYRLTPAVGDLGITIATAHFKDIVSGNGYSGIDLVLTNVASNALPGQGATSYISGLLLAFDYDDADLPSILVEQFTDDTAQSDRWEPQEDVATVDGFTFTSELGFPRSETSSTLGARLGVGEKAHIQFWNDGGSLPTALSVASLVEAIRGSATNPSVPDIFAAVKVRSAPNLSGSGNFEVIESVPTVVIGGVLPVAAPVPVPAALPLFLSALAGLGLLQRRRSA
jgi:hypothetical protein